MARAGASHFVGVLVSQKLGLLCTFLLPPAGQPSTLTALSLKPSLSTHPAQCTALPPPGALFQSKLYTL